MTAYGPNARAGAISGAAAALDAVLGAAAVDEYFTLILRACARGGRLALSCFCDAVEDPSKELDEAPARALVAALADREAADRALRAVAWAMAAQRFAETWPLGFYEVLVVARAAMPLTDFEFERMQILGSLTSNALRTTEPDERDGMRAQFCRESLEHVIAAATGRRPARRDMLLVIPPWTACFIRGIHACDEHLRELEALHPGAQPA
ncbi:MAG: hypothetical protein QOE31_3625 [Solirubrobacteraceae bacterium]|nr:hypothetical protein [Solirubrobacteraceae bacterium]